MHNCDKCNQIDYWESPERDTNDILHWKNKAEFYKNLYHEVDQVTGILCDKCGWAFKPANDKECRCELDQFVDEQDQTIARLAGLLISIARTIKGPPAENQAHSWHDLPELVKELMNDNAELGKAYDNSPVIKPDED